MAKKKCGKCRPQFNRDAVPTFVIQGVGSPTPLDNKYATVQFIRAIGITYGGTSRTFRATEVIALPYPIIHNLLQARPVPIGFRDVNEQMTFNQIYGM